MFNRYFIIINSSIYEESSKFVFLETSDLLFIFKVEGLEGNFIFLDWFI